MKASKDWGACSCNCGNKILPGNEMAIVDGCLYLAGHETKDHIQPVKIKDIDLRDGEKVIKKPKIIKSNLNKTHKWIKLEE